MVLLMLLGLFLVRPAFGDETLRVTDALDIKRHARLVAAATPEGGAGLGAGGVGADHIRGDIGTVGVAGGGSGAGVPEPEADGGGLRQDRVRVHEYRARRPAAEPVDAVGGLYVDRGAVLLLHSLERGMLATQMIAMQLSQRGFDAYLMELPGYGGRADQWEATGVRAVLDNVQAVADARRARDVIAAIHPDEPTPVSIVGLSLGSYPAATAAAIDGAFDRVVLILGGGDPLRSLLEGQHDASALHQELQWAGFTDDDLAELANDTTPLAVASRLNAGRTYLVTARDDTVAPASSTDPLPRDPSPPRRPSPRARREPLHRDAPAPVRDRAGRAVAARRGVARRRTRRASTPLRVTLPPGRPGVHRLGRRLPLLLVRQVHLVRDVFPRHLALARLVLARRERVVRLKLAPLAHHDPRAPTPRHVAIEPRDQHRQLVAEPDQERGGESPATLTTRGTR